MEKCWLVVVLLSFFISSCNQEVPVEPEKDMVLERSNVQMVKYEFFGFDQWGFNWKKHHFKGYIINAILADYMFKEFAHYKHPPYNGEGVAFWNDLLYRYPYLNAFMTEELLDCELVMYWNDALISRKGTNSKCCINSNGWITYHFKMNKDGEKWSHFRKLIARSDTDYLKDGIWYNEAGRKIGVKSSNWPNLIVVQVVNSGVVPFYFYEAIDSLYGPGFGKYKLNE